MSAQGHDAPDEQDRTTEREDDEDRILDALLSDDGTPVGDTSEVHDEISPADVPPDNPMRHELERDPSKGQGSDRR